MKIHFIFSFILLLLFTSCGEDWEGFQGIDTEVPDDGEISSAVLPEGYFEVNFRSTAQMRSAVTGSDGRVRHIRYVVYDSLGNFVKEKVILTPNDATPSWPLSAIKDTLPKGKYTAVFLGNVEKTLFPYQTSSGTAYADVLTNYKGSMGNARIMLPNGQFTNTSEYYWAKVSFSDASPNPYVLLQRIISMLKVHRNFVDAQTALNQLVNNIVTQIGYKNYIQTTVQGLLPGLLRPVLDKGVLGNAIYTVVGGLDGAVNLLASNLVVPVTDALYNQLLQLLVNQIGMALTGNTDQQGLLAALGVLLNPWALNEAKTAIVTMRDFPKSMDFNLAVKEVYAGDQRFRFDLTSRTPVTTEKDIFIRGFNGTFNVRKVNVIKQGLVSGLLVDQVVDGSLLLNGAFIDITDSLRTNVATNRRYQSDYSFLDLRLKSYTQQTDGNHSFTLSVKLGNIANIDGILTGIPLLGPVLGLVTNGLLAPIKNITVSVPINLPLLGVSNLELSGSWSPVTSY